MYWGPRRPSGQHFRSLSCHVMTRIASRHYCLGSIAALATGQYVRKFDSYMSMVGGFLQVPGFSTNKTICRDIGLAVESGAKHHSNHPNHVLVTLIVTLEISQISKKFHTETNVGYMT